MARPSSILIYGHDVMLLDTRRWVLEKAGYEVKTASASADVMRSMSVGQPDLLMLCHTLTADERRAAIETASSVRPRIKTLAIFTNILIADQDQEDAADGVFLNNFAGAEGLIEATYKLLG